MQAAIVYDSLYGNTRKIAEAITQALPSNLQAQSVPVNKASNNNLANVRFLIIGSPVHGGRPTPAIQGFIDSLQENTLKDAKVALFDTRFEADTQNFALKLLMKTIGYASPKMAQSLKAKGIKVISSEGFIVEGKEGPLKKGELNRAKSWAKTLL